MPYKKKVSPGSIQFKKLIAELPEKREKIKAQVQFRLDLLESGKNELITRMSLIDYKVLKNCQDWMSIQNQECKNYKRKRGNHLKEVNHLIAFILLNFR